MKHISRISVAKAQTTQPGDIFGKVTGCIDAFIQALTGAFDQVTGAFDNLLSCLLPPQAS